MDPEFVPSILVSLEQACFVVEVVDDFVDLFLALWAWAALTVSP